MSVSSSPIERASRVRYLVLAFVCALSMITYIDRALFPNAQGEVVKSLGLSSIADLTLAMTAFQLAYALFEVPTGWLGDRFGPRKTLIRIVLWWSTFIALTGAVGMTFGTTPVIGFWGLVLIRFMFGIGEAGAYPNITRALYNWFPAGERAFAQGAVWMSARLMGGLTPLIWLLMVDGQFGGLNWRFVFWMFGGIGVIWAILFTLTFRNKPEEHPGVNQAEKDLIYADGTTGETAHAGVPWGSLFTSWNLWAICGMYFCMNFGWYFFMNYLPTYLKSQFPTNPSDAGGKILLAFVTGAPLLLGVVGCLLGGWLSDRHVRRTGNRKWGRRLYGVIGFAVCSLCFLVAVLGAHSALIFAIAIAFAGFFNDLTMGPAWATCQDVGRRFAAIVAGTMNMIGNLGGALTTFITGKILEFSLVSSTAGVGIFAGAAANNNLIASSGDYRHQGLLWGYEVCLMMFGVAYLIGMLFWFRIDASEPLVKEPTPPNVEPEVHEP